MSEKIWSDDAWEDYLYWQTQDKKTLKRINQYNLLSAIQDFTKKSLFKVLSRTVSRVMSLDGHLSRSAVTGGLKRPTRKQTGRLMLSVRSCFGWGLHVPRLLPAGR